MTQSNFFHELNQLARHFGKALNDVLVPMGLYAGQFPIIHRLKKTGQNTQKELCDYLGVEAPTMTRTLSRMESAGWIVRIQGTDRREKYIKLTNEALAKYPIWFKAVRDIESQIAQGISLEELNNAELLLFEMKKNLLH